MVFTSGFFSSTLGTVTVSTPFSIAAFTSSILAFSGRRNRRRNLPLARSTRCHLSFFSSCSLVLSPLIWRILPSSTSTFTSSFLTPGRSTLNTWASGVSFQSTLVLTNCDVSRAAELGCTLERAEDKNPSNGSQTSRENGSNTLVFRLPKKLGISDMVGKFRD
uniref:Uncharacterized protein n=1 Tax=Opuntia streptacantha TaxID=393608 RepID=A0A7C9D9Y3_OPUST